MADLDGPPPGLPADGLADLSAGLVLALSEALGPGMGSFLGGAGFAW